MAAGEGSPLHSGMEESAHRIAQLQDLGETPASSGGLWMPGQLGGDPAGQRLLVDQEFDLLTAHYTNCVGQVHRKWEAPQPAKAPIDPGVFHVRLTSLPAIL